VYAEGKRELVSVIIGSFVYALVSLVLISAGLERLVGTLWTLVLAGIISGVVTFLVSYLIVFRYWDWVYRNRTKIVSAIIIIIIIMLTQLGRMVR